MFGLFGNDDGCNAHHFGNYRRTGVFRLETDTRPGSFSMKVQEKRVRTCEHEDCYERDESWMTTRRFHGHREEEEFHKFLRGENDLKDLVKRRHRLYDREEAKERFGEDEDSGETDD